MNKSDFIKEALNSVLEMHVLFGHPEGDGKHIITQDLLDLRDKLVLEERDEVAQALETFDKENYAKELCDLLVVALGGALCISDECSNLFEPEFLDTVVAAASDESVVDMLAAIKASVEDNQLMRATVMSIGLFLREAANETLNLYENFGIVHENNMSKSCLLEESAAEQVADYKMQGINCSYEFNPRSNRFIIKRKDSKILKPSSYKQAVVKLKEAV